MIFNGSLQIANGEFKTVGELIRASIAARDLTDDQIAALLRRWRCAIASEGFLRPTADLYMIDAYKGIVSGEATQDDWEATDFTNVPGGGELLPADLSRHFDPGTPLDSLVLYNGTGGNVTIYTLVKMN